MDNEPKGAPLLGDGDETGGGSSRHQRSNERGNELDEFARAILNRMFEGREVNTRAVRDAGSILRIDVKAHPLFEKVSALNFVRWSEIGMEGKVIVAHLVAAIFETTPEEVMGGEVPHVNLEEAKRGVAKSVLCSAFSGEEFRVIRVRKAGTLMGINVKQHREYERIEACDQVRWANVSRASKGNLARLVGKMFAVEGEVVMGEN